MGIYTFDGEYAHVEDLTDDALAEVRADTADAIENPHGDPTPRFIWQNQLAEIDEEIAYRKKEKMKALEERMAARAVKLRQRGPPVKDQAMLSVDKHIQFANFIDLRELATDKTDLWAEFDAPYEKVEEPRKRADHRADDAPIYEQLMLELGME